MPDCARHLHVPLDDLPHDRDTNGTLVAARAVEDATRAGCVVVACPRSTSPNGLAWPGVTPAHRWWRR